MARGIGKAMWKKCSYLRWRGVGVAGGLRGGGGRMRVGGAQAALALV